MWRRILGRPQHARAAIRVEPGCRIYAIGDIHGRADLLKDVLARIDADSSRYRDLRCITVFLGDYIDRGPDSRGVLEELMARSRTRETVCLMGNHEAILLRFLGEPETWQDWAQIGGAQTLLSYGLRPSLRLTEDQADDLARNFAHAFPPDHRDFLYSLPYTFESGNVLFVHAGLKPGIPLAKQDPDDLIWIRDEFLTYRGSFGKIVVHGHTPVEEPEVLHNRINLDTGAYATGRLSCLVLQDQELTFL
jgi:serine/threonine protein phosphatase 1